MQCLIVFQYTGGNSLHTTKWLKQKQMERYQNYIYFAEKECKEDVICFEDMVDYFVRQYHNSLKDDDENERKNNRCNTTQLITLH